MEKYLKWREENPDETAVDKKGSAKDSNKKINKKQSKKDDDEAYDDEDDEEWSTEYSIWVYKKHNLTKFY